MTFREKGFLFWPRYGRRSKQIYAFRFGLTSAAMSALIHNTNGTIATLTFDRPETRNPVNVEILLETDATRGPSGTTPRCVF